MIYCAGLPPRREQTHENDESTVLKGHGFSRADGCVKNRLGFSR
jgi:hypothetical protein